MAATAAFCSEYSFARPAAGPISGNTSCTLSIVSCAEKSRHFKTSLSLRAPAQSLCASGPHDARRMIPIAGGLPTVTGAMDCAAGLCALGSGVSLRACIKRTFAVQNGMSVLPPKADINRHICACISPTDFMSTRPNQRAWASFRRLVLLHRRGRKRPFDFGEGRPTRRQRGVGMIKGALHGRCTGGTRGVQRPYIGRCTLSPVRRCTRCTRVARGVARGHTAPCPPWARSGCEQMQQRSPLFDHLVGAQ